LALASGQHNFLATHGHGLMPDVFDWQQGDPRLALERAVAALAAGKLVVFPTETGYHVAASVLDADALAALDRVAPAEAAVLAVPSLADALRWTPAMSTTARRLARRVWPGPVTLVIDDPAAGTMYLRMPAHVAPLAALQRLPGPCVFAPLARVEPDQWAADVAVVIDDGPMPGLTPTVVRVRGETWEVTQAGAVAAADIQALMPTTVLFVCTGNTCRSPLAEALCKKLLAEQLGCTPAELPGRGFLVLSAGLAAMMGAEASPEAVEVARACGADLAGHRSQPLTADLLARADYVFAMTQGHLRAVQMCCPDDDLQARLLASDDRDVPDPIGAEPQVYHDCAQLILRYLQDRLPEMRPLDMGSEPEA
jgi:protein-tyrosine phosphatase